MTCELLRPAEILYCWLVNTRSLGINIRFHFAGKPGLVHEMTALFSATVDFILAFGSLSVFKHLNISNNISMLFCYLVFYVFFLFSVKVVSTWISVSSLLLMLPIPRMPQQYQMRRLKLLIKSSVRPGPDLSSNFGSSQLWKCSVSTS